MTHRLGVTGKGYGICGEPFRISPQLPQPRRRRDEANNLFPDCAGTPDPAPGKHYLLDTRLLMGGTHLAPTHNVTWIACGRVQSDPHIQGTDKEIAKGPAR